jgi:Holliday junction resolvasome RuvABC DNA-binding subunit
VIVKIQGTFSGWVGKGCVVDCKNGLSYAVAMVDGDLDLGSNVELWVYEHTPVEGKAELFGFKHVQARETFAELLKIKGVGPISARQLLQVHGGDLLHTVASGQTNALQVKGIGPKTAALIVKGFQKRAQELLDA